MKLWKQIAIAAGTAAATTSAAYAARRATLHFLGRRQSKSPRLIPAVPSTSRMLRTSRARWHANRARIRQESRSMRPAFFMRGPRPDPSWIIRP